MMKKIFSTVMIILVAISLFGCTDNSDDKVVHNVFFDTNGGTLIDYASVIEGDVVSLPANPTKRENVFAGWYLDNHTFANKADDILALPIASTFTIYAKWVSVYELSDNPKVAITLFDDRRIVLELFPAIAPVTVANFLSLIEEGYYTSTVFHRIIASFMIQAGHLSYENETVVTKPQKESIKGEFIANGVDNPLRHTAGVISMARAESYNSASVQFFICAEDSPHLDGIYTAFGKTADSTSLGIVQDLSSYYTTEYQGMKDFPFTNDANFVIIKSIEIMEAAN